MARVTINEIKKMMETEKDMTCVMDATRRMMKKNCEALEKHNAISEKQLEVMEKHTEMLKKNLDVMEKYIELMEKQMTQGKENEEKITSPASSFSSSSSSSTSPDIIEIPLPPPVPATPEPPVKKAKVEGGESRWGPPPSITVLPASPWINPPRIISSPISLTQLPSNVNSDRDSNPFQNKSQSLMQKFNNPFKKAIRGCIYCGEAKFSHISEKCTVLRDCNARASFMTMNYLCLTCAEPRYRCGPVFRCRFASRKCDHCEGIHLNALCPTKYPANSPFTLE